MELFQKINNDVVSNNVSKKLTDKNKLNDNFRYAVSEKEKNKIKKQSQDFEKEIA